MSKVWAEPDSNCHFFADFGKSGLSLEFLEAEEDFFATCFQYFLAAGLESVGGALSLLLQDWPLPPRWDPWSLL